MELNNKCLDRKHFNEAVRSPIKFSFADPNKRCRKIGTFFFSIKIDDFHGNNLQHYLPFKKTPKF